jgi:hypothetical protein
VSRPSVSEAAESNKFKAFLNIGSGSFHRRGAQLLRQQFHPDSPDAQDEPGNGGRRDAEALGDLRSRCAIPSLGVQKSRVAGKKATMQPLSKRRIIRESLWFLPCGACGFFVALTQNNWQSAAWARYGYIAERSTASIVVESIWQGAILGLVIYLVIVAVRVIIWLVSRYG